MHSILDSSPDSSGWIKRHPVPSYFVLTFGISWAGALFVVAPSLLHKTSISQLAGLLIFPAMLLGPFVSGLVMAGITNGRAGIRGVFAKMNPARVELRWYSVLLLPPALVLWVLGLFKHFVAPKFAPNHFWLGVAFGIPAGLLEEIGWTGFALPAMRRAGMRMFSAAFLLGILWGLWHLPAINYLGASAPHGHYWFLFFVAFSFAMTAMRALIVWLYENTRTVLLAQLMHISSTGSLVVFSPPLSSIRESLWYFAYGGGLWLVVAAIFFSQKTGRDQNLPSSADGP